MFQTRKLDSTKSMALIIKVMRQGLDCRPLIFQSMNSVRSKSLSLIDKDIGLEH